MNLAPTPSSEAQPTEIATLAGGCFWCLEAVYEQLRGVVSVTSGYSGGQIPSPTYEQVSRGSTGHAEVVQIAFDPGEITYQDLLEVFFTIHDPTTLNRQGADVGTQYRSAIFYHSEQQRSVAEKIIERTRAEGLWSQPIVTEVEPFEAFYPAEDYHQEYYRRNMAQPYCRVVIAPKVARFRREYLSKLRR
jgi:peptide-methionine (S)-S-oxide reductase